MKATDNLYGRDVTFVSAAEGVACSYNWAFNRCKLQGEFWRCRGSASYFPLCHRGGWKSIPGHSKLGFMMHKSSTGRISF